MHAILSHSGRAAHAVCSCQCQQGLHPLLHRLHSSTAAQNISPTSPTSRSHRRAAAKTTAAAASISPEASSTAGLTGGSLALTPLVPHVSVLLQPILEALQPLMIKTFVDGTLGAGGHASALLQAHPEMETFVGIDLDPTAHRIARARLEAILASTEQHTQLHLMRGNYSDMARFLQGITVPGGSSSLFGRVDAMLLDLGVSSMQLDTAERGFSFNRDGPIDMRMDPDAVLSAQEVINSWPEFELGRILRDYGEEKQWRLVASRIVAARARGTLTTTKHLVDAIGQTQLGGGKGSRRPNSKMIHPATRTFQALRIVVNDEMRQLEKALPTAIDALAPGGRLAVISFHSLEDRIVKHTFARAVGKATPDEEHRTYGPDKWAFLDELQARAVARLVTRKAVVATEDESAANPRSRSAKLRVIEKLVPTVRN